MDKLAREKIDDLYVIFQRRLTRRWKIYVSKYACENIVELGVYKGRNFQKMIEHPPKLAVAVDAWIDDGVIARNDMGLTQDQKSNQYERFKMEVADKPFVKICRGYTFDIVNEFPDDFFNLIYIDADHTYEGCLQDLRDWWPKMRSGAAITGDDYRDDLTRTGVRYGVIDALKTFSKEYDVEIFPMPRLGWATIKP
jgi:hypothetical protein